MTGQILSRFPRVIWLTGLSGAGKSTLARHLHAELTWRGVRTLVLDGDDFRRGVSADLGFSEKDRRENLRRAAEVAALLFDADVTVVAAFISPYRDDRARVRARFPAGAFTEVFVHAPLSVCERRDPKGLYRAARRGETPGFTGISAPYEPPIAPDVTVDTHHVSVPDGTAAILAAVMRDAGPQPVSSESGRRVVDDDSAVSVHTPDLATQYDGTDCGAVALAVLLAYYGRAVPLNELRAACGVSEDGCTARDIMLAATKYGVPLRALKNLRAESLMRMPMPCIAHWRAPHFVVLEGANQTSVAVNDPARGRYALSTSDFATRFDGIVLFSAGGRSLRTGTSV